MAFNYCRGEALKCDFGKKNPIDSPPLNLEIANLRHTRVGATSMSRCLNGIAVSGTGRKRGDRGFVSRYDQIEDPLREIRTLDEVRQDYGLIFAGPLGAKLASRP